MADVIKFRPREPLDDSIDIRLRLDEIEAELMDLLPGDDWSGKRDEPRIAELQAEHAELTAALAKRQQFHS